MKLRNQAVKYGKKVVQRVAAVGAGAMVLAGSAMAAVPTEITTAITDAKSDSTEVAGLCLGLAGILFGFRAIKRAMH
ncbi:major capsid protein [Uliginosibacterium sp. sgz301328]|uniref:major capsid protein n=1 Tax=Uliginosibacterium sp. sgz301328 TaxID=3243764 RepID=UPI00359E949A